MTKFILILFMIFFPHYLIHGNENKCKSDIEPSGTLPILYINVYDEKGGYNNEIIDPNLSHKNYFSGSYWLDLNGCDWIKGAESIGAEKEMLPLEIKARGNWTRRAYSKKPFKIKLGKKKTLLGLSESKHFVLLAHADDTKGYLRNYTGFNLGQRIGLPWTPSQIPVEVIINGDYRGLYFLTESIRVEEDRLNISELKDGESNNSLISGGYIIELDNYIEDEDRQIRMVAQGEHHSNSKRLWLTFDTPETYSDLQRRFINDQFSEMNKFVGNNSNDLWSYLDLDDAVRYYLVCELVSHLEAYNGSTYLFRERVEGEKWHFSPLWDLGHAFAGPTDGYIYDHSYYGMTWIGSFTLNEKFNEKLQETWKWFMSNEFFGIYEDIKSFSTIITEAAKQDYLRWKDVPPPTNNSEGGKMVADNSNMQKQSSEVLEHLQNKVEWLTSILGDYKDQIYDEPERDSTPPCKLPEYALSDLCKPVVYTNEELENGCIYYNLKGERVNYCKEGYIYIRVTPKGANIILFNNR